MALKFKVEKNSILTALNSLQVITSKKGTMPILSNVLLNALDHTLELIGTDLEVGIKRTIAAEIYASGSITLPSKKIFEIVRESSADTIAIEEVENNWVRIHAGTSNYNLAGMATDEYPVFPPYNEEILVKVPAAAIAELIDKTLFSVAHERETNYALTGVLFEKEQRDESVFLKMISSDGHRLTLMEKEVPVESGRMLIEKNTIIPKKGLLEIRRICEGEKEIEIGMEKNQAVFKTASSLLVVRLKTGEFPEYGEIISLINKDNYLDIDKVLFLESLKRTNIFTDDTFNSIQLDISNDRITLSSQNADFGSARDELSVSYGGQEISIGFNCRYLLDTLTTINGDVISLYINSDESPCLIKSNDDLGFTSVIMPMKV